MIKKIKNNDSILHVWCGQEVQPGEYYTIQSTEELTWGNDATLLVAIANSLAIVNDGSSDITDINSAINYLKGNLPADVNSTIIAQPPFAEPLYRVKNNSTDAIIECQVNEEINIDFAIGNQDRYISGGTLILLNHEMGDHVSAEVYDKDGIIPAPYRAALCEAHPTVAKYVEKQWICPGNCCISFDTRPLNAKIPAGLYLRITYHAANSGTARKIAVNYNLQKKL